MQTENNCEVGTPILSHLVNLCISFTLLMSLLNWKHLLQTSINTLPVFAAQTRSFFVKTDKVTDSNDNINVHLRTLVSKRHKVFYRGHTCYLSAGEQKEGNQPTDRAQKTPGQGCCGKIQTYHRGSHLPFSRGLHCNYHNMTFYSPYHFT